MAREAPPLVEWIDKAKVLAARLGELDELSEEAARRIYHLYLLGTELQSGLPNALLRQFSSFFNYFY